MDEPKPPPPVSPDGTHWWNGYEWLPMPGYEPVPLWRRVLARLFDALDHVAMVAFFTVGAAGLIWLVYVLMQASSDCVAFC